MCDEDESEGERGRACESDRETGRESEREREHALLAAGGMELGG